jgi:hypothetical protein
MTTYVYTLLVSALAAALVELISPKGEGGKLASSIRMLAGLCLLVALLSPLREGLRLLESFRDGSLSDSVEALLPEGVLPDYGEVFGDTLTAVTEQEVEAWVQSLLVSSYGIPAEGCTVSAMCDYEAETMTITEVRIALRGKYALTDPHPIESAVTQALGCPCFVTVGEGKENA